MYHSLFFNSGVLEIMITIALNVHFQEFVLTEVLTIFYRSLEYITKNMLTFKMETNPMTFHIFSSLDTFLKNLTSASSSIPLS